MAIGNDIPAMKRATEEQQPYKRADCPICAWNLETLSDGSLHCPFCGWVDFIRLRPRSKGNEQL